MAVGLAENLGIQENPWVFSIVGIVLIEALGGKFRLEVRAVLLIRIVCGDGLVSGSNQASPCDEASQLGDVWVHEAKEM